VLVPVAVPVDVPVLVPVLVPVDVPVQWHFTLKTLCFSPPGVDGFVCFTKSL
jgi:hypothetical protein